MALSADISFYSCLQRRRYRLELLLWRCVVSAHFWVIVRLRGRVVELHAAPIDPWGLGSGGGAGGGARVSQLTLRITLSNPPKSYNPTEYHQSNSDSPTIHTHHYKTSKGLQTSS